MVIWFGIDFGVCEHADQQSARIEAAPPSLVDARFAATKCPGLSVVATHNKIILSKAWGKADLEQNVPMTTASVDRLASLSKPITGDSAICDYFARVTGLVTESHNAAASLT